MKNKLNFITKSFLIKTFAVLMMIGMMDSLAFSQTRIRFARGKSSTTVTGTLGAGASRSYVLGARKGQGMLIRADSPGDVVSVDADGATDPVGLFIINRTGDFTITVYNNGRRSTKFSMYVEIR